MYAGREDYRYLVTTGSLVAAAVVVGQLVADGSIILFGIEIDEAGRLQPVEPSQNERLRNSELRVLDRRHRATQFGARAVGEYRTVRGS